MSNTTTIKLTGQSGKKHQFYVYELLASFKNVGGIYAFSKRTAKQDGSGTLDILYIGKTEDLSTRFQNHHKADCVAKNGANRLCVCQVNTEKERDMLEKDLIKQYSLSRNDQLVD